MIPSPDGTQGDADMGLDMRRAAAAVALVSGIAVASPAVAGELRNQPGLTPFQQSMAGAIDVVCPKLVASASTLNTEQTDLRLRCTEMKQNANALQGSGATTFSLGLSNQQLNDALGVLSPEEAAAQSQLGINGGNNQARTIGARLSALRGGARGFGVGASRQTPAPVYALVDDLRVVSDASPSALAASDMGGRLGAFVNGRLTFGDKDGTTREQGFDFISGGVTGGVDYRLTDNVVLGVALSYTRSAADMDFNLGETTTDGYGIAIYGTYYVGGFYLDAHAGFEWQEHETERRIVYSIFDRTARGTPSGQQYTLNLGAGYDVRMGALTVTPYGRAEFVHIDIDSFTERGAGGLNLFIDKQTADSLQTALGGRVAYAINVPFGVLVPQISAEWRHEFLNDDRTIAAKYAVDPFNTFFFIPTDRPVRDYFALSVGASAVFARGISSFVNYETALGLRDVTNHAFTGGVRLEF
jgi:outer membrane autotransporter protein